jgi:hypothetical protein
MGSTSRSITHRWITLGEFLYIYIVLIHFGLFFVFLFYGHVVFYVIFFIVVDVK